MFRREYARRHRRRRALAVARGPDRASATRGTSGRPTCADRRSSKGCRPSRAGHRRHRARGCWRSSATASRPTTSRRRDRSARRARPACGCRAHGVPVAEFNSYGARRGNHEVMIRGHLRQPPHPQPARARDRGRRDRCTCPTAKQTTIFDAAMRYQSEGVPLVVIAGKEYGSGSSRDWAAKGPALLGRACRDRRELRAHPPVEPDRHGRAPPAVRSRARTPHRSGSRGHELDRRDRAFRGSAADARRARAHVRADGRDFRRCCASTPRARPSTCGTAASCPLS